jgi:HK97 gp10 family phage protein
MKGMRELALALSTFPDKLQRSAMGKALRAGGIVIRNLARSKVARISGKLRASIRVSVKYQFGRWRAQVIAGRNVRKDDPFYALFVHEGTEPHEINPRGKKSLFLGGLSKAVERVKHPGAKANPFLRNALNEGAQQALEEMRRVLGEEIGNFTYDRGML